MDITDALRNGMPLSHTAPLCRLAPPDPPTTE